jgi:DNA polymerase-1
MLRVVDSVQDAFDFVSWLSERHVADMVAVDTETTGLNHYEDGFGVRLVQFGTAEAAWVIPLNPWRGVVEEAFRKYDGTWAFWNAAFDVGALRAEGITVPWHQVDDAMIACRLAEPHESAGLKEAATRHGIAGAALAQHDLHKAMAANKWDWATVPIDFPPYLYYAAQDTVLTSRLHQHPTIQRGMHSPVFALEMQVLAICWMMSINGMRIDLDYAKTEALKLRETTESITKYLGSIYEVLPGSTQQLGKWFLSQGAKITETTPGGAPSTSKRQLGLLLHSDNSDVREVARLVLDFRKAERLAGTYLEGFGRLADGDGILHAQVNTLAARTGRMSIREPALQTLPKPNDDPMSRLVRQAVIPRNEGEVLISADWAQIEGRIAAHVSGDVNLIEAFNHADATGGDFFVEMGKLIYRDPSFTKKDDRRKIVKGVIYGLLYGAGAPKMAETAGITEGEASEAKTAILDTFPGLSAAMKRYERAGSSGSVTTHYGRLLQVDEDKAYTGLNTFIQGTAADCLKNALVLLAHAGLDTAMVVPVHDEVVCSVPAADVEEVEHLLVETMRIDDFAVGVPAESSGPMERWGSE